MTADEQVSVLADSLVSHGDDLSDKIVKLFKTMLATSTSIDECGDYARSELALMVEEPALWSVVVA